MLPVTLLDENDDYWEALRRFYLPKLMGSGTVTPDQYTGYFRESEEAIEAELVDLGFRRNPIAYFKEHTDGRQSEGSWVLLHEDAPDVIPRGMQLHLTLFACNNGTWRDVYAHYEYDWRKHPILHLLEIEFSADAGIHLARRVLNDHSFLTLYA